MRGLLPEFYLAQSYDVTYTEVQQCDKCQSAMDLYSSVKSRGLFLCR